MEHNLLVQIANCLCIWSKSILLSSTLFYSCTIRSHNVESALLKLSFDLFYLFPFEFSFNLLPLNLLFLLFLVADCNLLKFLFC